MVNILYVIVDLSYGVNNRQMSDPQAPQKALRTKFAAAIITHCWTLDAEAVPIVLLSFIQFLFLIVN